jgi:hypothetical protein
MANTELLQELQSVQGSVYRELNASGVNLSAREDVLLKTFTYTGTDKHKREPGSESEVSSQALTVISLEFKDVPKWNPATNTNERIGDAALVVSADDVSEAQLLGTNLAPGQKRYFLIGGDRYSLVNGSLRNPNGLKWILTLVRAKT